MSLPSAAANSEPSQRAMELIGGAAAAAREERQKGNSKCRGNKWSCESDTLEPAARDKLRQRPQQQQARQLEDDDRERTRRQPSSLPTGSRKNGTDDGQLAGISESEGNISNDSCRRNSGPQNDDHHHRVQLTVASHSDQRHHYEEDHDQDQDQDQSGQVTRPLIRSERDLTRSKLSLREGARKSASMVQVLMPEVIDERPAQTVAGDSSRRASQSSSCQAWSLRDSNGWSSSVLESSRRSSTELAVELDIEGAHVRLAGRAEGQKCAGADWSCKQPLIRSSSASNCLLVAARGDGRPDTPLDWLGAAREFSAGRLGPRAISQSMLRFDGSLVANEKFQLTWSQLTYAYPASLPARLAQWGAKRPAGAQANQVLRNLSGRIESNQLVAIIGPSGCGKTSLLQFLAGNNGAERERLRIRGLSEPKVAYIGQHDGLLPGLTAREVLIYASRLQNAAARFDHAAHVEPILAELGLLECADRSVSKLSGGQAKRVVIAQELLYPTNLLILDEVTSGLDASTSYSIVKLLKYLVSDSTYPMSIVISIHQPSARLFSVFDRVYVMSQGACLYEGSCNLDQINEHLRHFQLECPKFHNMADYLIELASSSPGDARRMIEFHQKQAEFGREKARQEVKEEDEEYHTRPLESSLYEAIERARLARPRPFWSHLGVHFSRSLLRIRRSHILTWLQLLTYITLGLQLSTFYGPDIGQLSGCPRLPANLMSYILTPEPPAGSAAADGEMTLELRRIQENMNFLLVAVMTATFAALEITVITFPMEAKTIKREWCNGWYRVSSYFMGRTLADLPFQLSFVVIFSLIIYSLTGQLGLDSWRFGAFVFVLIMTAFVAQSFGFIFGALFMDNLPAAVFTAPLAVFPTLLFSGFFSRISQVPSFYRPLTHLSHFRYAFDALLVTLYGFDRCNCDQEALSAYHAGLVNQTNSMRDLFQSLFGASDCLSSANSPTEAPHVELESSSMAELASHDHLLAAEGANETLASMLRAVATTSTTVAPRAGFEQLEDMLVDSIFQQMAATSSTEAPGELEAGGEELSAVDKLAARFSTRMVGLLNKQANFGHPMPTECANFNSYLLTEFQLTDQHLWHGLVMLALVVLITRLLCNFILHFTIASRAK